MKSVIVSLLVNFKLSAARQLYTVMNSVYIVADNVIVTVNLVLTQQVCIVDTKINL